MGGLYLTLHLPQLTEWPRCYYDRSRLCGDREVDNIKGVGDKPTNPSWHIAGFCDCPSCPLRCAIASLKYSSGTTKTAEPSPPESGSRVQPGGGTEQ